MNSKNTTRLVWSVTVGVCIVIATLVATHLFSTPVTAKPSHLESKSFASSPPHATHEGTKLLEEFSEAFEAAAERVNPSVVPILSEHKVAVNRFFFSPQGGRWDPFGEDLFRRFFETPGDRQPEETLRSLGSGVIVSQDGYILTNSHVVQDADKLTVMVGDSKRYEARVIGSDPQTDLAVIKIDAKDLPAATMGDSDDLRVGQWVIAVGNPLQMLHSVTAGIISATGRSSVGLADYEDFIQTDASINPGNSGGALADLDGRVIGINTAIASPSGGNVGVGFAIPIRMAQSVMEDLIADGRISRGFLGVVIQNLDDNLAKGMGLESTSGALVGDVNRDGAADKAGVKRGDVIVAFEGKEIKDSAQLRNLVASTKPGTRVDLKVLRNGREKDIRVVLDEHPATSDIMAAGPAGNGSAGPELGLSLKDLTPEIARQLRYEGEPGALVSAVEPGSPAEQAGLRRGDLVQRAGDADVRSARELQRILADAPSGGIVVLLVRRDQNTFFLSIEIP